MIQYNASRNISSATGAAPLSRRTASDGPETWGKWYGRRHYSLEIVQHPIRARMCGFGDKDRRPLAPAAVAKLIVRRDDDTLVDVDDIDGSFFVVTVDLWSADGKQEMNLVLHPSSSDRYAPAHPTKQRRRGPSQPASGSQTQQQPSGPPTPSRSHSTPSSRSDQQGVPLISHQQSYSNPMYYSPQQQLNDPGSYTSNPYATDTSNPTWGYPSQSSPPALPSIHSFGGSSSSNAGNNNHSSTPSGGTGTLWNTEGSPPSVSYRGWSSDATSPYDGSNMFGAGHSTAPEGLWHTASASSSSNPSSHEPSRYPSTDSHHHQQSPYDTTVYASMPYTGHHPPSTYHSPTNPSGSAPPPGANSFSHSHHHPHQTPTTPNVVPVVPATPSSIATPSLPLIPPLPRHTYTRTLVGPLSASASRLLDEHRKPGVFFLFQDLSVRTEGTFRLRLRLMNIGAHPAPESGAGRVHTDVSPVLAQTFSEPFVVFSAKRFPGVPDTTALSIAFGNQGQKLPIRNRHGSSKQGRNRRGGGDSDGSDDGSS